MSEKTDRKAEALARLEDAVNELTSSDAYLRWLDMQVKFHSYSMNNTLLIGRQCPHATFVRGFKAWLDLGRAVRKGERGIFIFAPMQRRFKEVDEETGEEVTHVGRMTFGVVAVFDVSQTDPIPGHPKPFDPEQASVRSWWVKADAEGDGAACSAAYAALREWYCTQGHVWSEHDSLGNAHGSYHPRTHEIRIERRECAPMLKTAIHEVTHYLTAQEVRKESGAYDYDMGECVAESIAYVVCSVLGIEATVPSSSYIAYYIAQDRAAFLRALGFIAKRSHELIDVIEGALKGAPVLVEVAA